VLKIVAVNELCVFDHELLRTSHAVLGELRVGLAAPYDLLSFAECIVRSGSGLLACLQFIDCRVAAAPARNILYLSNLLKRSSQICLFAILVSLVDTSPKKPSINASLFSPSLY
jgi:hypothetical protein